MLYSERFGTFFLMALPPAVVAYVCQFLQRILVAAIRDNGWMPSRSSPAFWVVITEVVLFEGAVYWIVSGLPWHAPGGCSRVAGIGALHLPGSANPLPQEHGSWKQPAILESPLFIAITLLYHDSKLEPKEAWTRLRDGSFQRENIK